jgi:hypothetical protein
LTASELPGHWGPRLAPSNRAVGAGCRPPQRGRFWTLAQAKTSNRMPKLLTIAGMVIAAILFLLFGLDLAIRVPFSREVWLADVFFLVCAAILGYMSWMTYREQT